MDESYTLHVPSQHDAPIILAANSSFGVLRAFETLLQVTSFIRPARVRQAPITITDKPRFPVRGLMINAAGDWMPLPFIKRIIDGLTVNKLNYLHLHLTDVTSFPVVSKKYPQLASKGRFGRLVQGSPESATTYSADELRALVGYAAERGVRIVPEVSI